MIGTGMFGRLIPGADEAARWRRRADAAGRLPPERLARLAAEARAVAAEAGRFLRAAEARRAPPAPAVAPGADWAWRAPAWAAPLAPPGRVRPAPGHGLAPGVTLFHDCPLAEFALRQLPGAPGGAPFALSVDVFRFRGAFLSLVVDLPEEAARALRRDHVLSVTTGLDSDRPLERFLRLNIRHGPNTETAIAELPADDPDAGAAFDLAETALDARRVEGAWVDLILDRPDMTRLTVRDFALAVRPRAEP